MTSPFLKTCSALLVTLLLQGCFNNAVDRIRNARASGIEQKTLAQKFSDRGVCQSEAWEELTNVMQERVVRYTCVYKAVPEYMAYLAAKEDAALARDLKNLQDQLEYARGPFLREMAEIKLRLETLQSQQTAWSGEVHAALLARADVDARLAYVESARQKTIDQIAADGAQRQKANASFLKSQLVGTEIHEWRVEDPPEQLRRSYVTLQVNDEIRVETKDSTIIIMGDSILGAGEDPSTPIINHAVRNELDELWAALPRKGN